MTGLREYSLWPREIQLDFAASKNALDIDLDRALALSSPDDVETAIAAATAACEARNVEILARGQSYNRAHPETSGCYPLVTTDELATVGPRPPQKASRSIGEAS